MNQEQIGKFISESRKNKNMTQEELAEKLRVSSKSVSRWENGRNMPDVSLFKPLCDLLDISINELLSGKKLDKKEYQDKLEENIVNTISYSNKKNTKKNNIIFSVIATILILIALLASLFFIDISRMRNNKPVLFSTWGFDYNPPINLNEEKIERTIRDYLLLKAKNDSRGLNNEKTFVSIKTYLIKETKDKTIAYLWSLKETFYEENGNIIEDSGSSIPYKITLESYNDDYVVLEYQIPRDGSLYVKDMKKLFPKSVRKSMDNIHDDGTIERLKFDIEEQKENYYSIIKNN